MNDNVASLHFRRDVFRNVTVVSLLSSLRIVVSLGVYILIASLVGLSAQADAFFVAFTIPAFSNSVFYNSKYVLISVFSKALATQEPKAAHKFFSIILSLAFILLLGISILSYFLAPIIVILLAPGAGPETRNLAVDLLRILSWMPLFAGLSSVSSAMLNAAQHFTIAASAELIRFSVAIIVGLAFPASGIYGISAGLLAGAILQLLVVTLACYQQLGFRYWPNFNHRYPGVMESARLTWVAVQGMLIRQGTPITDRLFASFLPTGSIALIQYGARLTAPTSLIFFDSIVAVMMPTLTSNIAKGNKEETNHILRLSWRLITLVSLPVVALLLGLNYPLISLLFQRGAFDDLAVARVVPLSLTYNLSLLFWGYMKLQNSYFYATNDKRSILRLFTLITVADILIKGILLNFAGPLASAIAFSSSVALTAIAGTYLITRSRHIALSNLMQFDLSLILMPLVMGTVAYVMATEISASWSDMGLIAHILAIIGGASVGVGIFVLYILFWRREDLRRLRYSLK